MAAVLRCRPKAWITGEALLGLLHVEGFDPAGPLRVLVPEGRTVSNVPFTVVPDPTLTSIAPRFAVCLP